MHCLCPYGLSENTVMIEKATTVFYINDADEDGHWPCVSGQWSLASGQWPLTLGNWPVH